MSDIQADYLATLEERRDALADYLDRLASCLEIPDLRDAALLLRQPGGTT